jgi:hypothetical protein
VNACLKEQRRVDEAVTFHTERAQQICSRSIAFGSLPEKPSPLGDGVVTADG